MSEPGISKGLGRGPRDRCGEEAFRDGLGMGSWLFFLGGGGRHGETSLHI